LGWFLSGLALGFYHRRGWEWCGSSWMAGVQNCRGGFAVWGMSVGAFSDAMDSVWASVMGFGAGFGIYHANT
ncbi:hypothetical protein U1Q18_001882, partial [Sarracenia purpurea var. burkii]